LHEWWQQRVGLLTRLRLCPNGIERRPLEQSLREMGLMPTSTKGTVLAHLLERVRGNLERLVVESLEEDQWAVDACRSALGD